MVAKPAPTIEWVRRESHNGGGAREKARNTGKTKRRLRRIRYSVRTKRDRCASGAGTAGERESTIEKLKSRRSSPRSSAASMTKCHTKKVWRKNQQDLVDKESKALEDALDEARYSLLKEQKQVNARMCR